MDLLIYEDIPALVQNSDDISNIKPEIDLNNNIKAPIMQGDILGRVSYTVNGLKYTSDLISSHDVEQFHIPRYVIYICLIFVIIILIYIIFYHTPKKYRKRR